MSPFPHVRREKVPITDPRHLASLQPDPEPETDERRGLDGNGTMRASDLPERVWGAPQRPMHADTLDMDAEPEVRRTKCLALSEDVVWPQQCWDKPGHVGRHDWEREPDAVLTQRRKEELRDTPSDVLPRRVPGEALREAEEAAVSEFESEGGTSGPDESVRPGASAFRRRAERAREVIETWPA